jgi:hypothetical protein
MKKTLIFLVTGILCNCQINLFADDTGKTESNSKGTTSFEIEGGWGAFVNYGDDGMGPQFGMAVLHDFGEKGGLSAGARVGVGLYSPVVDFGTTSGFLRLTSVEIIVPYRLYLSEQKYIFEIYGSPIMAFGAGTINTGGARYDEEEKYSFSHFGVKAGIGLGYSPKNSKTSYLLRPLNLSICSEEYLRFEVTLGVEIKLSGN